MHLQKTTPALVVVDMQNDFVRPGAPMAVPGSQAIIPGIAQMMTQFRAQGLPVICLRFTASERYNHLAQRLPWINTMAAPTEACKPGVQRQFADGIQREGFAVIEELAPEASDIFVDKVYFGGFHDTDLAERLRELAVDTVCVCGVITEMCVEDTARQAVHHGYRTVILRDLTASANAQAATAALAAFDRNFGWVVHSDMLQECLVETLPTEEER